MFGIIIFAIYKDRVFTSLFIDSGDVYIRNYKLYLDWPGHYTPLRKKFTRSRNSVVFVSEETKQKYQFPPGDHEIINRSDWLPKIECKSFVDKFLGITNTIIGCVSSAKIIDRVALEKPQRGMSFFFLFCQNERLVSKGRYCSTELFRRRRKDAVNGEKQQFLLRCVLIRLIVFRDSDSSSRLFSHATEAIKSRNDPDVGFLNYQFPLGDHEIISRSDWLLKIGYKSFCGQVSRNHKHNNRVCFVCNS